MVIESRTVVSIPRCEESFLPIVSVICQIYLRADEHDLAVEYEHPAVIADIIVHYWTTYPNDQVEILHMTEKSILHTIPISHRMSLVSVSSFSSNARVCSLCKKVSNSKKWSSQEYLSQ